MMPTAAPQSKFMRKCKNITQNNRICYIFELNYYKKSVAKLFCNSPKEKFNFPSLLEKLLKACMIVYMEK